MVENTPEEIAAAVEMDDRLKGTWKTTAKTTNPQCFWALFTSLHGSIESRVGADFLRTHRRLLEDLR